MLAWTCADAPQQQPTPTPAFSTLRVPLTDVGTGSYLGFTGGLYPGGTSALPYGHAAAGLARGRAVRPLDRDGKPSASGEYVLLSVGMSNTTQEFCSGASSVACASWSFVGQALADPEVDHSRLVLVDGAAGGKTASAWDAPSDPDYDRVRDTRLGPMGASEAQVQVVWLKVANPTPSVSLPASDADACVLVRQMGDIVRAAKVRYPNLQQLFISSRIYAGYASTRLNPEPFAYESGLAVKWVIEAQITEMSDSARPIDPRAGDLSYETLAPWIAWGPYLWADGASPRSDGLSWLPGDFAADGTHPSRQGQDKVARLLLQFFKTSPETRTWFLNQP
jgi:hypothetical protein